MNIRCPFCGAPFNERQIENLSDKGSTKCEYCNEIYCIDKDNEFLTQSDVMLLKKYTLMWFRFAMMRMAFQIGLYNIIYTRICAYTNRIYNLLFRYKRAILIFILAVILVNIMMYSDSRQETMLTNRESQDITLDKLLAIVLITAFFYAIPQLYQEYIGYGHTDQESVK